MAGVKDPIYIRNLPTIAKNSPAIGKNTLTGSSFFHGIWAP
jgi:hypothetical protein